MSVEPGQNQGVQKSGAGAPFAARELPGIRSQKLSTPGVGMSGATVFHADDQSAARNSQLSGSKPAQASFEERRKKGTGAMTFLSAA